MKQPSIRPRLFLSTKVCMMAPIAMAASLAMVSPAAASPDMTDPCGGAMTQYEAGLPGLGEMTKLSAAEQANKLSASFREVMQETEKALVCYQAALDAATSAEEKADLEKGMRKTARIYAATQAQFEGTLDAISNDLLGNVAPAAGGSEGAAEANNAANVEQVTLAGMEVLFDSFMLFERSQELSRRFAGRSTVSQ